MKNCPEKLHSEDMHTRAVHLASREAQWTQSWPRVQSQVDVIHLVCSTGTIMSNQHLHTALRKQTNQEWASYAQCDAIAIVHTCT